MRFAHGGSPRWTLRRTPRRDRIAHPPPDADEPCRLQQQEQDHDHAEGGVVEREHHVAEALGQIAGDRLDRVGKENHKAGAEQRAGNRAHAADDDHRHILHRQIKRERVDRNEIAKIGEQRAGDRGHGRADHEGQQFEALDVDAERAGDDVALAQRPPRPAGAGALEIDAHQKREARRRRAARNTRPGRCVSVKPPSRRRIDHDAGRQHFARLVFAAEIDDDEMQAERADGEVKAAQPQRRQAENQARARRRPRRPPEASSRTARRSRAPERRPYRRRRQAGPPCQARSVRQIR